MGLKFIYDQVSFYELDDFLSHSTIYYHESSKFIILFTIVKMSMFLYFYSIGFSSILKSHINKLPELFVPFPALNNQFPTEYRHLTSSLCAFKTATDV